MPVIHLLDVIREHSDHGRSAQERRPLPRPVVDASLPVLALPPGRSERPLRVSSVIDAGVSDDGGDPRPQQHTLPSGHPIFAQWLRCRAAKAGC
jgi:hypothetical protein